MTLILNRYLELIEEDKTINEVASKYDILPKSLQQWKKQFLENSRPLQGLCKAF